MKRFFLSLLVIITLPIYSYGEQVIEPEFNGLYAKFNGGDYIEIDHKFDGYSPSRLNGLYHAYGKKYGKKTRLDLCVRSNKPKITILPLKNFHSFVEKGGYKITSENFYKVDVYDDNWEYMENTKALDKAELYCQDRSFKMDLRIKKYGKDSYLNKPQNVKELKKDIIYGLIAEDEIYFIKFK